MASINQNSIRIELNREPQPDAGIVPTSQVSLQVAYGIRYIELTRPIAGAFLWGIHHEVALHTGLTGSSLLLVGSTIANFIAWLIGEQIIHRLCIYFNLYTETKSKNPLFRNFKTLASLGVSLGIILATLRATVPDFKIGTTIYSASASLLIGLCAFGWRRYRQSMPMLPEDKKNIDAQVGTEGWSKYTKIALVFGNSIGQSVGGYMSYTRGCEALASWEKITFYGAIAATISFFAIMLLVPVINYLTRDQADERARGIFVATNQDVFNTNYIRTGMTLGVAIGTILGGLLAPALLTGMTASLGIAIGAGVFSIISGLGLGIYGYKLSLYLQNNWGFSVNSDNNWSYASRNTSYVFGFIGTAVACILCPGATLLQSAAIGSAISGLIGWFVGLMVVWKARQLEPDEQKTKACGLSWTQRITTGANRGSTIGAFGGLLLGFAASGSLGLIACILLISALGGIAGAIIEGMSEAVARDLMWKFLRGDSNPRIAGNELENVSNPRWQPELANTTLLGFFDKINPVREGVISSPYRHSSNRNALFFSTTNRESPPEPPKFIESFTLFH